MLVAAALCAASLVRWPLWGDELWTWMLLDLPFADLIARVSEDYHPPGYFALVWALLPSSAPDALLRLPSALGAVGAVAVAGAVGRRWYGAVEGGLAAWALAVSPFLVVYAGIARGYALLAFVSAALLAAAVELVGGERVRAAAVGLAVAGIAAIFDHYAAAAALVASAGGVGIGLLARPDRGRGRWAWAIGAFVVMACVFGPWALGPMERQDLGGTSRTPTLRALAYLGWPVGPYQPDGTWLLLVPATLGVGVLLARRRPTDLVLLAWAACGVAIPLALSGRGYMQAKFYVQAWFLPAWACLVGVGAAAVLGFVFRRARPLVLSTAGGAVLAAAFAPALWFLWSMPAGPFGLKKGNTAYDVRQDLRVFADVLPIGAPSTAMPPGGPRYLRYRPDVMAAVATAGWRLRNKDDERPGSIGDSQDAMQCAFEHAFIERVVVPEPSQCDAVLARIEAIARTERYPPFLLELAAQAHHGGRLVDAELLAREAVAVGEPIGWSGPDVFLARFHFHNRGYAEALAAADAGLETAVTWQNLNAARELYGMRAELLTVLGRDAEARVALLCATGDSLSLPCPYADDAPTPEGAATSSSAAGPP